MATLKSLKSALEQKADAATQSTKRPLSDTEYKAGFDIFMQGSGWITYRDFIIPQLSKILTPLFGSRTNISILEIGPGPKSVLGYLPSSLRRKIGEYTAFEPNELFAKSLKNWLYPAPEQTINASTAAKPTGLFRVALEECPCPSAPEPVLPFPSLKQPAEVVRSRFSVNRDRKGAARKKRSSFDVVLFCHSMYGINPKRDIIEQALESVSARGIIVIFHQDRPLPVDGLVCHRTAAFPTGAVSVANTPEALDSFAPFVAGFMWQGRSVQDSCLEKAIRSEWRKVCRAIGRRDDASPNHLTFSSPDVMVVLTRHAKLLPELTVPRSSPPPKIVKNGEAQLHSQAAIVRPTTIYQIQRWVQWALKHRVGMSVLGGGHSGHCLWSNAVAVDMDAFQQIHVLVDGGIGSNSDPVVIAGSGCRTGDIVRKAMAAKLTVPLGSRPSVGAGLWLQGGIGHLARVHGLACDAIVGAVIVSVDSGRVLYVGRVPINHRPRDAIRPDNEADLLWAIKGAGTNFGIVVSVTFKAYHAPTYSTQGWVISLEDKAEAQKRVADFDSFASKLPRNCSADAYLYWDADHLHLGIAMINASTTGLFSKAPLPTPPVWMGPRSSAESVNGIGLFETEMYMSGMHGGHGAGKTSSFKRCVFLKGIGSLDIAHSLITAIETRATPMCYIHLLQGGAATRDVPPNLSAFGCRDWDFACVITGVWPRDKDQTEEAHAAVKWVYNVAKNLLPLSRGAYSADLGPDPRDAALATKAFGPNRPRLSRLKRLFDPHNVLPYAAPLPEPNKQTMVVLISGEHGAGKDHCAGIWVQILLERGVIAHAVSISEATKRQYAAATGADLNRLLHNRAYKEEHRRALTAFFKNQMQQRPRLVEEHFLDAVYGAVSVDVLFITGIKDEAPVAAWSHLVPGSRLLHVHVEASKETRSARREGHGDPQFESNTATTDYRPSLIFDNDVKGDDAVKGFAERQLLPLVDEDVQRLARMVRQVPDFPRPGFEFRHLLDFAQEPNGLKLCTSLLQSHFTGDWAHVNRIACCEAGGFIFASALSQAVNVPLALIRGGGKLPPPVVSVCKLASHVSSSGNAEMQRIEVEQRLITQDASVVVVDDVLATGKTLCAVLELLVKAGACIENIRVMVVAELPRHRGRDLLCQHGFGAVHVESLLVLDGE